MPPSFDALTLERLIVESAEAARPAERLTVSQAAEKYRYLNSPGAYVGPWKNSMTPYLVEPMDVLQSLEFTGMCFVGPAQTGKALALDTPIPTPHGWSSMGALKVGDEIIGADGKPCRVVGATEVKFNRECFRVTFSNGESVVADAEHNWAVFPTRGGVRDYKSFRVLKTSDIVASGKGFSVPKIAMNFKDTLLPLDPYVLGAWLGDGHSFGARIYCHQDDAETLRASLGVPTRYSVDKKGLGVVSLSPERHNPGRRGGAFGVSSALRSLGLSQGQEKFIPIKYLRAGENQRRALLQGLLDTDGHASTRGRVEFSTAVSGLADGFRDLCVGLGYNVRERFRNGSYMFQFSPFGDEQLFRFPRKQNRMTRKAPRRPIRQKRVAITSITPVDSVPVRCISVDGPESLYMFGTRGLLTHNTDMFLNWLTHTAICDPADMMLVQTSQTTARDFSMRRVDRLHRYSPEVGRRLVPTKESDNVFDKHYQSGMLLTLSWPTINELSGKPIPRHWLTDYDRMSQDVDGEGSPFDLTRKRGTTFRRYSMTAVESSPGFTVDNPKHMPATKHEAMPTPGILSIYNRGDRRRWYWRCVKCSYSFEPDFPLLVYPDTQDIMEAAEAAVLRCPHCGVDYPHDPGHGLPGKDEMNLSGRWVKDGMIWLPSGEISGTAVRSDIASFWLKGVAAAFSNWKTLVYNYIAAERVYEQNGTEEALKTTVNTDQGLPYVPKMLANDRSPELLKARARGYSLRTVPPGVRFITAAIDVQKNRFVVQVTGVHDNGDRSIVDRFEIRKSKRLDEDGEHLWVNPGAYPEDWKLLCAEVFDKTYPLSDGSGRHMAIKFSICDSGGKAGVTANAYDFVRWLRNPKDEELDTSAEQGEYEWKQEYSARFMLLKGASAKEHPRVRVDYPDSFRKDRHAGARGEIPVCFINPNTLKDTLNNMLDRTETGGRINFAKDLPDNFYTELTVEVKDPAKGWVNPRQFRNESWDLLVYHLATCLLPQINFDAIRFDQPPGWAEEWDHNDLVFNPVTEEKPFDAGKRRGYGFGKLAKDLA